MAYVKRLVDRVIANDLGCPDLEFVWSENREFDPLTAARIDDLALRNGSRTINEVRDRLGLDTLPGGDQPMVLTPTGYVLLVPVAPQKLGKADFVEGEHPRQPAGSPDGIGGQFAPKDSVSAPSDNPLLRQPGESDQAWHSRLSQAITAAHEVGKTDRRAAIQQLQMVSAALEHEIPDYDKNKWAYQQHISPDFFYNPSKYGVPQKDDPVTDLVGKEKDSPTARLNYFVQPDQPVGLVMAADQQIYDISEKYNDIKQAPPNLFLVDQAIQQEIQQYQNEDAVDHGDYSAVLSALAMEPLGLIGHGSTPRPQGSAPHTEESEPPPIAGKEFVKPNSEPEESELPTRQTVPRQSDGSQSPSKEAVAPPGPTKPLKPQEPKPDGDQEPDKRTSEPEEPEPPIAPKPQSEASPPPETEADTPKPKEPPEEPEPPPPDVPKPKPPLRVVIVQSGGKGAWNKELNNPQPLTEYIVDGITTYITDVAGRVVKVVTRVTNIIKNRNNYQQRKVGLSGQPGDHGGHLIATVLGGIGEKLNLVAMSSRLNLGKWKMMEAMLYREANAGKDIELQVEPQYVGTSTRPVKFVVRYRIDGGELVTLEFRN